MTKSYHHGDLRRALVDVAIEIIDEEGMAAFSVAEACRRLKVSPGAPYRHFTDRSDILVEIAIRAIGVMAHHVSESQPEHPDPLDRLAHAVRGYVVFAAEHPALFEVVFSKEVFIGTNEKMREAARPVAEAFVRPAYELPGISRHTANSIVMAAAAIAHGYGALLGVGSFDGRTDAVAAAAGRAAQAVRALISGPDTLLPVPDEDAIILAGTPIQTWVDEIGVRTR
ncbi:TetR/AcrR family transcriptional regulator [Mycolicibacterium sp.]|uniref:TetR/AcrR family transcriptional regulator n=1 Tax=Mycolicibacterium sp. TaxID=2320850 RepID=UPI003D0E7AB8